MAEADIKKKPWCPFCGQNISKPQFSDQRKMGEFAIGECQCGAFYVCDPTGHNVGSAMVECLVSACGDNWDLAWDLLPDEDYLTGRLENYDDVTNQVVETRNLDGRAVRGVVYFIRLQKDIADLVDKIGGKEQKSTGQKPKTVMACPVAIEPARDPRRVKARAGKSVVRDMVVKKDIDGLVDLCFDDKRTLRFLRRLLYTPDESQRWLIAYIIGQVCARVSTLMPGLVSDQLQRLYESCTDSASSNWGAVEAIGSIIAARVDLYGAFTHHLLNFINDELTRPQVLWALGEVAETRPDLIRKMPFYNLFELLSSQFADIRGLALRLFGRIKAGEVASRVKELCEDGEQVIIYERGMAVPTTVGRLAEEALAAMTAVDA